MTLERELGIPVMPHMDIRDFKVQCETEVNFIDRIVYPLWEHLSMNFPSLAVCIEQIRANRDKFQASLLLLLCFLLQVMTVLCNLFCAGYPGKRQSFFLLSGSMESLCEQAKFGSGITEYL